MLRKNHFCGLYYSQRLLYIIITTSRVATLTFSLNYSIFNKTRTITANFSINQPRSFVYQLGVLWNYGMPVSFLQQYATPSYSHSQPQLQSPNLIQTPRTTETLSSIRTIYLSAASILSWRRSIQSSLLHTCIMKQPIVPNKKWRHTIQMTSDMPVYIVIDQW